MDIIGITYYIYYITLYTIYNMIDVDNIITCVYVCVCICMKFLGN